ncbi:hypothetical protein LLH00_04360 [bacterium]|nr:hypothetical protein [bacterium]
MRRDSITIVLVPETREPMTMEFSLRELALFFVLLLTIFSSAGYSLFRFRDIRREYSSLSSEFHSLKIDLKQKENQLESLKSELDSRKGLILLVDGKQDTTELSSVVSSNQLKVEDVQVRSQDTHSLSLGFRLTNTTPDERPLNGYLMVIAQHKSGDVDMYGTFPELNLERSRPVVYSLGDSYSIRRFKQIDALVPLKDSLENYTALKILAFNDNGDVLLNDSRVLHW